MKIQGRYGAGGGRGLKIRDDDSAIEKALVPTGRQAGAGAPPAAGAAAGPTVPLAPKTTTGVPMPTSGIKPPKPAVPANAAAVGKAFRSARILADNARVGRLGAATRNPSPTKQAARTSQDLEQAFLRERRPDLLRRTQAASRSRSDRVFESGPRFRPISARQSSFNRSGVGKARYYDPEHRRQRRIGMGEAGLIGAGGTGIGFGIHGAVKTTRRVRAATTEMTGQKLVAARGRQLAMLGGGAAALGGAAGLRHHAESRRGGIQR